MKIGLVKAIKLTSSYGKMSLSERERLRENKLKQLVTYAKNNSPYFNGLYAGIGEDFKLTDLPVTNKVEMLKYFDTWVTDRKVHLSDIMEFMNDLDNVGRGFMGRYLVFTTSGSTGNPSIILCDKTAKNVMDAIAILRAYARKEDLKAFIKKRGKTAGVFATGGFYLGYASVRNRHLRMPWKKRQAMITSILNPIEKIVEELNRFQPAMLGGYPTALELLAEEKKSGRLRISPILIMAGGEYFSKELREMLCETFQCYVQTNYSCTEGGMVASECENQHFHINDDWIIVEPVDKDNNPVPDGVQSDKWLLTNLSNYTQPLIRYEITDRIILHREGCACRNPSPWVEIEGRTDDILHFHSDKGTVRIIPLALYAILKEVHEINRFQLILKQNNQLELRLVCRSKAAIPEAFAMAEGKILQYLKENGITDAAVYLSEEEPKVHPKSGKFKHVYQEVKEDGEKEF